MAELRLPGGAFGGTECKSSVTRPRFSKGNIQRLGTEGAGVVYFFGSRRRL
jgi:hypothetical protein